MSVVNVVAMKLVMGECNCHEIDMSFLTSNGYDVLVFFFSFRF